jgi:hypothetical protein
MNLGGAFYYIYYIYMLSFTPFTNFTKENMVDQMKNAMNETDIFLNTYFTQEQIDVFRELDKVNISDICYRFIDENIQYFDLHKYTKDHRLMIDELKKYSEKQTCSQNFFKLLISIYEKSKYIDLETFIQVYTDSVNDLHSISENSNIVFFLPFHNGDLSMDKSNFYFSLYFIYLYRKITKTELKNIYHFISECSSGYQHQIDIDDVLKKMIYDKQHKETIFVMCDDYSYSGSQIVTYMNKLKTNTQISLYLVIAGISIKAKQHIHNFVQRKKEIKGDINNIVVFFPQNIYIDSYDNTFEYILDDIIRKQPVIKEFDSSIGIGSYKDYWLAMNDMYIITYDNEKNKLYATGQIRDIGYGTQTLTYLFFKYPDSISTIPNMCFLDNYSNNYTFIYNNLTAQQKHDLKKNKFEITNELIGEKHLDYLLTYYKKTNEEQIKIKKQVDEYIRKNLSNFIEICNPELKFIDLMNCDKEIEKFEKTSLGICNSSCWKPFYKAIVSEKPFIELKTNIKPKVNGYISYNYVIPEYNQRSYDRMHRPKHPTRENDLNINYDNTIFNYDNTIFNYDNPNINYDNPFRALNTPRGKYSLEQYVKIISDKFVVDKDKITSENFKKDIVPIINTSFSDLEIKDMITEINNFNHINDNTSININHFANFLKNAKYTTLKNERLKHSIESLIKTPNSKGGHKKKMTRKYKSRSKTKRYKSGTKTTRYKRKY